MDTKKICMIGDLAVGKTSLVSRYVYSQFSSDYLTTIGVKIDTKELLLNSGNRIKLVLWDIAGTDSMATIAYNYLKGAAGYLIVADGTRSATFDSAVTLQQQAEELLGPIPFTFMLNKYDLSDLWTLNADDTNMLESKNMSLVQCSAKTGEGVEDAFQSLGERMSIEVKS